MLEYITENTLADSFIFGNLNQNKTITMRVQSAIESGKPIKSDQLQEQMIQLKKTQLSPLWTRVVDAYESGEIVLVYSDTVKIPTAIPFFITKTASGIKAFIFMNNYTGLEADGKSYDIPFKTLYVLMEGAYISLRYITKKDYFVRNIGLMKICMNMYVGMVTRILNKEYALTLDTTLNNNVTFAIAKYFLTCIWGMTNDEMATNYAISACLMPDMSEIKIFNDEYNRANITDLAGFTNFLKTSSDRMATLTLRYMMERWINTYKQGGLLAMDCLPYLFFSIENLLLGTFIVNQTILRDITRNVPTIKNFYAELSKLI